jgi:hypothetical protein
VGRLDLFWPSLDGDVGVSPAGHRANGASGRCGGRTRRSRLGHSGGGEGDRGCRTRPLPRAGVGGGRSRQQCTGGGGIALTEGLAWAVGGETCVGAARPLVVTLDAVPQHLMGQAAHGRPRPAHAVGAGFTFRPTYGTVISKRQVPNATPVRSCPRGSPCDDATTLAPAGDDERGRGRRGTDNGADGTG